LDCRKILANTAKRKRQVAVAMFKFHKKPASWRRL
jgi:hypothetical protein